MFELMQFMQHHQASSGIVFGVATLVAKLAKNEDTIDPSQHQPLFHALGIIGAWSALEAYVADFCKAVMREQPDLIDSEDIQSIKIPIAEALTDDYDKFERVYVALEQNFGQGGGVNRFESVLQRIGLSEQVPKDIKKAVFEAQKIRNVWAHNAGRADTKFLKNGTLPRFEMGDKVAIDRNDTALYVSGLLVYGHIIMSRWRTRNGLDACKLPENVPLRESYESIYPSNP
jgi:hypothetical protein